MASTRKLRNVNKRFSKDFEVWPDTDRASANKSTPRKRKLSDMLGTQWSKEELERFYEAYRKYGKDWKKIASTVRNRSHEMVEALYYMNKAYLSLPEGTATAAGLIAMMTDHYNILEGSDSDGESNDGSKTSRKPQKRGRGKFRAMSKVSDGCSTDQAPLNSSRYGCLSLLKKQSGADPLAGSRPRAVGKRTPRVPVSNMYNKNDKGRAGLVDQPPKSELAADDEGAHVAALALAEVLQRGGSPQVSRTPRRRVHEMKSSPVKSTEERGVEPEMEISKLTGAAMNEDCLEASLGSREAENVDFVKESTDGFGMVEGSKKMKKHHGKSPKTNTKNLQIEDDREACSGTEEGSTIRKIKDENDMEVRDGRPARGPKSSRKRSRQLFFGDESSSLDALHTLADLSVNLLPVSAAESESSTQVKEEPKIDSDQKSNVPEQFLSSHHNAKANILGKKERIDATSTGSGVINKRSPKVVKVIHQDTNAIYEMNQQACACASRTDKRRGKSANVKMLKSEFMADSKKSELQMTEVSTDEGKVPINKIKRAIQGSPQTKQGKLQKVQENSSVTEAVVPVVSASGIAIQAAGESQNNLVIKRRSRRKLDLQKAQALKESKFHETSKDHRADRSSYAFSQEKLSNCLSSKLLRRWCMFEWFYSAIDYPWFAKSEFVEYLNHVRLGHIPRLTRVEWGVIRSSLGKPRRLSNQFLQEEREKLEQYRESVRMHYAEFRVGLREGLPTDLAKPLQVGQRVIACHPKTREIHDGSVLTVDRNRCRIQFDRPQLGVEFVMDIDCMPLNPLENIPEALRVHNIGLRCYSNSISNSTANENGNGWKSGGSMKLPLDDNLDIANGNSPVLASSYPMSTLVKQAKVDTIDAVIQAKATVHEVAIAAQQAIYSQPCTLSQIQEREADIRALAELSRALDKKEALLIELRHMNEVAEKQKSDDKIKDLENFRKQYAMILVQLRDVNDQVASSLLSLRQRNTYHGNSTLPWIGAMETSGGPVGPPEALNQAFLNQESGSHVVQIVETSRQKSRKMVDTAVQAFCALNDGEYAFTKIGEALDLAHNRDPVSGGSTLGVPSPSAGHTVPANQDNAIHVLGSKPDDSSAVDLQLPSELISSCVSTLLMIQTCTERQYPPAEIAQILDSAVASLQPRCPQNLPIYREIESCMGIIKNQMLSLIPTPSNISLPEIALV